MLYHSPHWILSLVGFVVRRLGEPLRSAFSQETMSALLAAHGFVTVRDQSIHDLGLARSAELGRSTKMGGHLRIVTADRMSR